MFYYIQEVSDYLTPPIAALFLLGVLWRRCNETGAFWGGMVGFTLGASRLVLALVYREPHCDQRDERPSFIKDVHFMYVAAILFWVSALVTVVVSLCTPPPRTEQIRTTTLWGLNKRERLKQQEKEKAGEDVNALKPLNRAVLNGKEKCEVHPNKHNGIEANHENAQPSNGHVITASDIETNRPIQNGFHSPISDPKIVEEGEGRGGEEEVGCFGEGEVEGGRCMKVLEWVCGFQEKPSKTQVITEQEQEKMAEELLHQPPRTRILLNMSLVVICCVGIFLFIYFSL